MSVLTKLMRARLELAKRDLKKTGENKFAGYKYFELGDFLPTAQAIFADLNLCGVVSFSAETATLTITDTDDGTSVQITSPMGSAALKGCHEVQNIGAVETYQRRYLWVAAFEIVEHDAIDATTGKAAPETKVPKIKPTDGVWEALSEEEQEYLSQQADKVIAEFDNNGAESAAALIYRDLRLTNDEILAMWTQLPSNVRNQSKKFKDKITAAQEAT